jgi:hypothetical protein
MLRGRRSLSWRLRAFSSLNHALTPTPLIKLETERPVHQAEPRRNGAAADAIAAIATAFKYFLYSENG